MAILTNEDYYPNIMPQSQFNAVPQANPDTFKYRIEASDILDELAHQLKGEVYITDEQGEGKYIKKFNPEMTEEGISEVINIIYSLGVNKNILLGCLEHSEIYDRCNSIWRELASYFVTEGYKIGVSEARRSMLLKKIVYMIHSALSRSERGREADQLAGGVMRQETAQLTPQANSFNPLAMLMGGNRGQGRQ